MKGKKPHWAFTMVTFNDFHPYLHLNFTNIILVKRHSVLHDQKKVEKPYLKWFSEIKFSKLGHLS